MLPAEVIMHTEKPRISIEKKNRGGPLEFFGLPPILFPSETGTGDDTCHVDVFYPFYYSPDPEGANLSHDIIITGVPPLRFLAPSI